MESLSPLPFDDTARGCHPQGMAISRQYVCWCLDLWLPSFQICEQSILVNSETVSSGFFQGGGRAGAEVIQQSLRCSLP